MGLLWSDNSVKITKNFPETIIHEHKYAPTDESIRLAKEYQEKIESQIAEKLIAHNNICVYTCAIQKSIYYTNLHIKLKINDIEYCECFRFVDVDSMLEKLRNWMAEKIIMEPFRDILANHYATCSSNYTYYNHSFGNEEKQKESRS